MKSILATDTDARKDTEAGHGQDELTLQMRMSNANVLETENSQLRASDLNLMTEGADEKDHSLKEPSLMSRNPENQGLLQFDSTLSGLVLIQKQMRKTEGQTATPAENLQSSDVKLSENCRRELGLNAIGLDDDLINLRIKSKQNSKSGMAGPCPSKKAPQQKPIQDDAEAIPPQPDAPEATKAPPGVTRQAQSVDPPLRSNGPGDQAATAVRRIVGRCLGPGTSQPPHPGFREINSSNERLQFANPNTWKSPMKTTTNAGAFSSHLKLTRQLHSNQKSNYKDYQRELLQQRSVRLEDELYQTQTTLRKKEGSHRIQIALLEQRVTQMRQEMSEAKKREAQQKSTYDKILDIINQQLLDANLSEPSYNAILINLNQVQNILHDANKTFSESMVSSQQKPREADAAEVAENANKESGETEDASGRQERQGKETKGENHDPAKNGGAAEFGKEAPQPAELHSQLREKNAIIQNYEKQNRDFVDEISELQVQICGQKKRLGSLEQQNRELEEKIAKLESELEEQRGREQSLKALHSDEMKYNADMNAYEQSLFQSRIKELESNLATMQNRIQLWNMTEASAGCGGSQVCVCSAGQIGGLEEKSPRMQMLNRSVRLDSLQKGLVKKSRYSTHGAAGVQDGHGSIQAPQIISAGSMLTAHSSQVHDRDCQTEESLFQESMQVLLVGLRSEYEATQRAKEEENEVIRERMSRMQAEREEEMQTWQHKRVELENTISKLKKLINQHLTNHKEATDMIRAQLKQAQAEIKQKEGENKVLKSKLHQIKQQIAKLERIQQGELSRSRSGSRHAAGFMFGHGRTLDSRAGAGESRYHQSCASSLSPSAQVERKQSVKVATMLRRHSKTPVATHLQKKKGPSSVESAGSTIMGKRPNAKQPLFGSVSLRQQVEDLIKNEQLQTTNLDTMTLQDALHAPASALLQRDRVLNLKQQLGILRKSAEIMSRSRSRSSRQRGDQRADRSSSNLNAVPKNGHNKPEKELMCRQSYFSLGDHGQQNLSKGKVVSRQVHVSQASKENQRQEAQGLSMSKGRCHGLKAGQSCLSTQGQPRQTVKASRGQRAPVSRNDIANGRGQQVCATQPALPNQQDEEMMAADGARAAIQTSRQNTAEREESAHTAAVKSSDIVSDRRRRMKASLKSRSSSRVNTVKKELVKRLHALQANDVKSSMMTRCAQNEQNIMSDQRPNEVLQDLTNKEEGQRLESSQVYGSVAPATQGEIISNMHNSKPDFNLQRIAHDIKQKESTRKKSAQNSKPTSARRPMAHPNRHQKSSADFAMSGDFCEWGLSPNGAGSSLNTNMQKMESYRLTYNQLFQSMYQQNHRGLMAGDDASKSQRYEDSSKGIDEKHIYFGAVSPNKKLIGTVRENNKSNSKCWRRTGPHKTEGSMNGRTGPHRTECSINPLLTYDNNAPSADRKARPSQAEKVNRILNHILSQPPVSQASPYHTQPRRYADSKGETSISERLEDEQRTETCQQVVEQLEPGLSTDRGLEIPGEFAYVSESNARPEVEGAPSDGSPRYPDEKLGVAEDTSSRISPVKQEAVKATIHDMVKGSPALETRRLHDQHHFAKGHHSQLSKSLDGKYSKEASARSGEAEMRDQEKGTWRNHQDQARSRRDFMSSSNSDTSLGSNQHNEERNVIMRALLEGAPPSATTPATKRDGQAIFHPNMVHPTCTSMNASANESPPRAPAGQSREPGEAAAAGGSCRFPLAPDQKYDAKKLVAERPVLLTSALWNKFDTLYARILRRDQKVNKLRVRNRGLQQKLDKLEAQYKELCQRFEATERQRDELQLQNQKFECRLKQAQIILNDPTDRVDLQLNCTSEGEGPTEEYCGHDEGMAFEAQETGRGEVRPDFSELETRLQSRQEFLHAKNSISSSIKDIQLRKHQIRQAESHQRSAKRHPVTMQGSCSRNSDRQAPASTSISPLCAQFNLPKVSQMQDAFSTLDQPQGHGQSSMKLQKQEAQQRPVKQQSDGDFPSKRAHSVTSASNICQHKKHMKQQAIIKEAAASPNGCVPKIDLSCLRQQQDQMELGSARWDQQAIFGQPRQHKNATAPRANGCQSQRGGMQRARQPKPSSTLRKLLHGPSIRKQNSESAFQYNFLSSNSNMQLHTRDQGEDHPEDAEIEEARKGKSTASGFCHQVTPASEHRRQGCRPDGQGSPQQVQQLGQRGFEAARTAVQTSRLLEAVERIALGKSPSVTHGKQSIAQMNQATSRACDHASTADEQWRGDNELLNSILTQTASQLGQLRPQSKGAILGAESTQTRNQDSKSLASTAPTKTRNGGASSSKHSFLLARDVQAPLPHAQLKRQKSNLNVSGASARARHLITKSSESALSSLAQKQARPARKMTQTVYLPAAADRVHRPVPHQQIVATSRSRPQLSTKLAQAVHDSGIILPRGPQTSKNCHTKASFR